MYNVKLQTYPHHT